MEDLDKEEIRKLLDINHLLTLILNRFDKIGDENATLQKNMELASNKIEDNISEVNLNSKRIKDLEKTTKELSQAFEGLNLKIDRLSDSIDLLVNEVNRLIDGNEKRLGHEKLNIPHFDASDLTPSNTLSDVATGVVKKRK